MEIRPGRYLFTQSPPRHPGDICSFAHRVSLWIYIPSWMCMCLFDFLSVLPYILGVHSRLWLLLSPTPAFPVSWSCYKTVHHQWTFKRAWVCKVLLSMFPSSELETQHNLKLCLGLHCQILASFGPQNWWATWLFAWLHYLKCGIKI